jgi:hypothetical protein
MKRFLDLAVITATAAVVTLAAAPAYADQNANASIDVSPSTVQAGVAVHISGSVSVTACPTQDQATVTGDSELFPPDGFGPSVDRNSHGDFALDYTVPSSTPAGVYRIGLRCGGGNTGVSTQLTVTGAPVGGAATGGGGSAPRSSLPWTVAGSGALVLAGLGLALRRRLARRVA